MELPSPRPHDVAQLLTFLDTLERPATAPGSEASARGERLFQEAGCGVCHAGELGTDNLTHDVGTGGSFQTPALVGVGARLPWIHDGCAADPLDRFDPPVWRREPRRRRCAVRVRPR
jgi:mono/diheme cytochrome c family protein